jgi:very-short-patch-repair endonuclease
MHGLEGTRTDVLEVVLPKVSSTRSHTGLTVRRSQLVPSEVTEIKGFPVTTLHRTLRDLCLFAAPIDALIALDAALQWKRTDKARLLGDPVTRKGRRGAARLRFLVQLAAPAESPMETRLRWLLIRAGLPKPEVQVDLRDGGQFIARADLFYPDSRLVIEFDGGNHRERLVSDNRRQNLLIRAGFRILRFTAADIFMHPEVVAAQVRGSP